MHRSRKPRSLVASLAAAIAQQAEPGEALRVEVLEGEGSINNIRELTMRSPVVRVLDATGEPVAGASVSFTTPAIGASAIFVERARSPFMKGPPRSSAS